MPRQPRLVLPEVALHVVQRGNDRQICFREDTDCIVYLTVLHELASKTCVAVHAYCLMTNHVHLLLTPSDEGSCAALMRNLGQRYVQYFNRRHLRTGTLWEGRYRSCLVDSAAYVLACHRYIERNPVRAGMVASPEMYRWSSYHGNAGRAQDTILSPHVEYLALAREGPERHAAYRRLVGEHEEASFLSAVRDATNGGYPLASPELKTRLAAITSGRRLERGKPGPRAEEQADTLNQQTLELGL